MKGGHVPEVDRVMGGNDWAAAWTRLHGHQTVDLQDPQRLAERSTAGLVALHHRAFRRQLSAVRKTLQTDVPDYFGRDRLRHFLHPARTAKSRSQLRFTADARQVTGPPGHVVGR